jgi:hypothetical protein
MFLGISHFLIVLDTAFNIIIPTSLRELYMENLKACYLFASSKAKFMDAILAVARVELFLPSVSNKYCCHISRLTKSNHLF